MSRAGPPFATSSNGYRRPQSPVNGVPERVRSPNSARARSPANAQSNGPNQTQPLSLNRQPVRPTTPNSVISSSKASPSRPSRSDLRLRQDRSNTPRISLDEVSSSDRRNERQQSSRNETSSPTLSKAAAAFQSAGAARRGLINGDAERAKERDRELEKEKERQRRMREKVQGRRPNGTAKSGDIDGGSNYTFSQLE